VLDILQDNVAQEQLGIFNIQREGDIRAQSIRTGAALSGLRAQTARAQIPSIGQAGRISAASTFLSGASRVIGGVA